jgi:hypothetical protein
MSSNGSDHIATAAAQAEPEVLGQGYDARRHCQHAEAAFAFAMVRS